LTRCEAWLEQLTLPKLLISVAALNFVLRIFYSGHRFQDDGLWFTSAEQLLRGKVLYREIYFDKPPMLPFTYAFLFRFFGAHIVVIRLFTVALVTAVSAALCLFGSSLYDRKTGVLAAALFGFFSTTGVSGHVQGLNTDFLMVLPYTLGAYFLTKSIRPSAPAMLAQSIKKQALFAFVGGTLTGLAAQTNPKGIFNLAFYALMLVVVLLIRGRKPQSGEEREGLSLPTALLLLGIALAGSLASSLPFVAYLWATKSLSDYAGYVWSWGFRYAGYFTVTESLTTGLRVVLSYLALNSLLAIAPAVVLARIATRIRRGKEPTEKLTDAGGDILLLIWLGCSAAAMATGGRFYTHYLFEILPALCLLSARGLIYIGQWAKEPEVSAGHRYSRSALAFLLAVGLVVTLVRFHTRTAVLAIDWARGSPGESTGRWFHEILNREERMAAGVVTELPGGAETALSLPPEAMREMRRKQGVAVGSPSDYLFVWGYRPEVYYWSGLIPASRFISIQPVTGIPADVQYINGNARSILPETARQAALDLLLRDLEETKPKYIVDEAGMFNSVLSITSYPRIADFMSDYKQVEATGRLMIYRRRDPSKRQRKRSDS
jgi:4-amino-4-deoxy-L-arabinose transferase-like glycosyltransferase